MCGMATVSDPNLQETIPKESALLKCESCGGAQRVWLSQCRTCSAPEENWYEKRIARLEEITNAQDRLIRRQADMLNEYYLKLRKLEDRNA